MNRYVNIDHIEFTVTYCCNSQCRHCYISEDRRVSHPFQMDVDLAAHIIEEVVRDYYPQSIMILGGEPLLFPDAVYPILETARTWGIRRREMITNAGWPQSELDFRSVAFRLAKSGVTRILISVDSFHQQFIPLDVVKRNVQSLIYAGIAELEWNPCWLISRDHDNLWNNRTKEILEELRPSGVTEAAGNVVQPLGNALANLAEFMPSRALLPLGICEDVPYAQRLDEISSLSVEPDGSVAVCKAFAIGNAGIQDISRILRRYDPARMPEIDAILRGGIRGLIKLARTQGVKPDPDGYYSICDACISLTRRIAKSHQRSNLQ
jgi:hypothetical protein